MGDQLGILLGLLILAYLFLSPFVLFILYRRQSKTVSWLEDELARLKNSLRQQRERWVAEFPEKSEIEELDTTGIAPETGPAQPQEEDHVSSSTSPVSPKPVEPAIQKETRRPVKTTSPQGRQQVAGAREVQKDSLISRVRPFLQGIGMWPPTRREGQDTETILMQWWLPRAGGFLALLSALFFGVYINQNTSPIFKCIELILVSLGVIGLGWFMERKYRKFGGVILVTGMIMLYLTSVAAYALQATRVIHDPVTGSILQTIVLIGICIVGWVRKSSGLVLLTFHFGYFLGLFMVHEGLREGALIEAGLLFIAGMLLARKDLFRQLTWVIIAGSFLVVLAFPILSIIKPVDLPEGASIQIYNGLVFSGILVAFYFGLLGTGRISRIQLSIGSSLAIAGTFLFFGQQDPDNLEWACFSLGLVMLVGSLTFWSLRGCGFAAQLLFIKSSFLIGTWAVMYFAGDLRWMVLALQTLVVAYSARRAGVIAMEILVWAVALVSLWHYGDALAGDYTQGTFVWWMMLLYPIVTALGFALLMKPLEGHSDARVKLDRVYIYSVVPLVAIGLWNELFTGTSQRNFDMAIPFVGLVYAAGALSFVPFLSRWMLLELAAVAFVVGTLHFCTEPFSLLQLTAILTASAISVYFLVRRPEKWAVAGESIVYLLSIVPLSLWVLQLMNNWEGQAVIVLLMCLLVVLFGMLPFSRQAGSWGFIPLLVFMLTEQPAVGAGTLNLAAYAAGLGWLLLPVLVPQARAGMGWAAKSNVWVLIGGALFWLYVIMFGDPEATWMAGQWVLGMLAILFLLACHRWRLHGYLVAAILFAAVAMMRHTVAMSMGISYLPWKSEALLSAAVLYAFALLWFFLKPNLFVEQPHPTPKLVSTMSSAASAVLLFAISVVTFQYKELAWIDWFTPLLAITAFVMILLGLFFRDTIYRRLGLLALLVPLARLFLVDVQDVLHRIIAFAASAVLLTLLGYLYHRLSSRLSAGNLND